MQVAATAIGLALLPVLPSIQPLVIANSLVGGVYMHIERDALAAIGSQFWWVGRVRVRAGLENVTLNLLIHLLLPWLLWRRASLPSSSVAPLLMELLGLLVLDTAAMYPTTRYPLRVYILAHVAVVVLVHARLRDTDR